MTSIMRYLKRQIELIVTPQRHYWVAIAILVCLCSVVSAQAQAGDVDAVTNIKLSPFNAVHDYQPVSKTFDFGEQDAFGRRLITHSFRVRNADEKPLVLDRVVSSCSCTTALIGGGTTSSLPLTLKPDAEVSLVVSINTIELFPGHLSKYVSVYAHGQSMPVAVFSVTGNLQTAAIFIPAVLQVGTIKVGQPSSFPLTVLLDKRLVKDGEPAYLVSYDPRIRVEVAPSNPHSSVKSSVENSALMSHKGYLTQAYQIVVKPSGELGFLDSMLVLAAVHQTKPLDSSLGTSIHVLGNVDGEIQSSPALVAFGEVNQGKATTQKVVITSQLVNELQGLKVDSPMICFQARLVPVTDKRAAATSPVAQALLEVTVRPDTPAGSYSSQVMVTTADGQHLFIPVVASVTSSKGNL